MSRIQKQVIKHFKKSVQPFTVDKGLYKLGFSLIRRNMLGGATLRQNNFIRHSCIRRLKIFRYRKRLALRRTYLNLVRFAANNVRFNPRSFSANFFSLFDATPVLYAAELKKSFVTLNVFIAYLARQVNLTCVDLNILVSKISRLFPGIPAFFLKYFL